MSEVGVSEVTTFFRYLVPGISSVVLIILALPNMFLKIIVDFLGTTSTAILLTGVFIVFGWASYNLVYRFWRRFLMCLRFYPNPQVLSRIEKRIGRNDIGARDFWSFFLWNYCRESIRERVKILANYGHSLYMVSFSFFAFSIFYPISKLLIDSNTFLNYLLSTLLPTSIYFNMVLFLESLFVGSSFLVASLFLYFGYGRIQYAENIQLLILRINNDEISKILEELVKPPSKTASHNENKN